MNTGYPTLNFGLSEEINMLRDAVHQMAQKEIAPRAADIDRENEFPADLWRTFGEMGLLGMTIPEQYGGAGMSTHDFAIALEEVARADGSVGLTMASHNSLCTGHLLPSHPMPRSHPPCRRPVTAASAGLPRSARVRSPRPRQARGPG